MSQFAERYKTLTNAELLKVIENRDDYLPEAVEAAMNEISQRNLSPDEAMDAKKELEAELQEKQIQHGKRAEVESKLKSLVKSVADTINPIQKSAPSAERLIRIVTIVFGLIAVAWWCNEFGFVGYLFTDTSAGWDFSIVEYLFPLIFLPLATILFGLRKKSGWILMAAFLTYSAIHAIGATIITWNINPSGSPFLDSLLPQTSPTTHIMLTLLYVGTLGVLNKRTIKEYFSISLQTAILAMSITAVLAFLQIRPYL